MPTTRETILIDSSPEKVFQLVKRFEEYPRFMPLIKEVKILRSDPGNCIISEWNAEIDGIPFHWIEKDEVDPETYTIRYSLIEGDMEQFEGYWRLRQTERGIELELTVVYSLGVPSIEDLVGLVMQDSLDQSTKEMLRRIKQECELD